MQEKCSRICQIYTHSPSFFLFNYPLIMFCCLLFPSIPISLSRISLFISLFFSLLKVSKLVSLVCNNCSSCPRHSVCQIYTHSPSFFLFNYPLIMFCCLLFPSIPISLSRLSLFISLFFSLLKVSQLVSLVCNNCSSVF
eukprot:sb/3474358/